MKRLKDNSDAPEARHGTLPKTCTSSKKKQGYIPPTEEWVTPCCGMHMFNKRDLKSVELETMRTSRSPATVMTANGEVQTREETTVYVKE